MNLKIPVIENVFEVLYAKEIIEEKRTVVAPIIPTLVESIYNNVKLFFDRKVKEFNSAEEAEKWAESNGVKIKIRHKAGSFVGENLDSKIYHRDDSEKFRQAKITGEIVV